MDEVRKKCACKENRLLLVSIQRSFKITSMHVCIYSNTNIFMGISVNQLSEGVCISWIERRMDEQNL